MTKMTKVFGMLVDLPTNPVIVERFRNTKVENKDIEDELYGIE